VIQLPGQEPATVTLSQSFWRNCSELRSADIGRWLLRQGLAPWPRGKPPTFELVPVEDRRFRIDVRPSLA
jgi:hypothetical protein